MAIARQSVTARSRSLPLRTRTEIKVNFDHVCRNINNSRSVQLFPQIQIYSDRGDVCLLTLPLYKSLLANCSSQNPHLNVAITSRQSVCYRTRHYQKVQEQTAMRNINQKKCNFNRTSHKQRHRIKITTTTACRRIEIYLLKPHYRSDNKSLHLTGSPSEGRLPVDTNSE